jgi:Raf kinase inhibitor-like YbhB/YbcL family protein
MRDRRSLFFRGVPLVALIGVPLAASNCSSDDAGAGPGPAPTGGTSSNTGGTATGGVVVTGGAPATGGTTGGTATGGISAGGGGSGGTTTGGTLAGGSGGALGGAAGSGGKAGVGGATAGAGGKGSGTSGGGSGGTLVGGAGGAGGASTGALRITSPDHMEGAKFADKYTCKSAGFNGSLLPELAWSGVPSDAKSLAITFIDITLTKATPPNNNGYHWVIYNIAPTTLGLPEEFKDAASIGASQNSNYLGPCPNFGGGTSKTDTYEFTLYALAAETLTVTGTGTAAVKDAETKLEAMNLAKAKLTGTSDAAPP